MDTVMGDTDTDVKRADVVGPAPRSSILFRTALLSWIVTILAIAVFIVFIIPYQKEILIDRMASTAEVISTSVDQVTVTSIVVEDYSTVIEHCLKVVAERDAVLYLVVTRKDGFSLISTADGWRYEELGGLWRPTAGGHERGRFIESELVDERVYHYTYPLAYSGIDWGWIHIGLSLDQFDSDLTSIYYRTLLLAVLCILAGSVLSFLFARRISQPILQLNEVTRRVAAGERTTRPEIRTGDEVESLANSFNRMMDALQAAHNELELRVKERTAELSRSNELLKQEITDRRHAEEARLAAEKELETQQALSMRSDRLRSLGEMAAGIAHELNQPLVGVRGLAEHILIGMQRGWPLTDEKLRNRLNGIVEQADRMVHIIDHVRRFARESGKPDLSEVDLNEVVRSGMDMLGAQFRSRGLELVCNLQDDLPSVSANPFSLEEVVLNLLTNARDAVEDRFSHDGAAGNGSVVLRTGVGPSDTGIRSILEVEDNGGGIPPEILSRVFDPFFTTKDPDKGTGLGLAISRSIVEQFGGEMRIDSEPGVGTTTRISLPAEDRREAREAS